MHRAKSEYVIQTVSNALRLLESFESDEEVGVTELARRMNLHKNNVFRLLATLQDKNWVEQSADNERYKLGAACFRLANAYTRTHGLTRRARPVLERLVQEVGETAHLGVLQDFDVVHLDGQLADDLVVTGLRIGTRMPGHSTALGKVLLACGPALRLEAFDRHLADRTLSELTEDTIVDRDKLIEHLRGVAAQGWALDLEETSRGLVCAAAPVCEASGRTMAALSVSAPAFRLDRDVLEERVVPAVVAAANSLSRDLGA
jgi:DNA-binding IclR family transcriptional regulator